MTRLRVGVTAAVALVLHALAVPGVHAQRPEDGGRLDADLRATVRFLADDGLQGRRAGTPGADLSALYLSTQFEAIGLEPAGADGSFEVQVPLNAVRSELTMVLGGQGQTITVEPGDRGIVGWPTVGGSSVAIDGELLFVGFGIRAPEFDWDDFGDAPVAGRILVMLAGDPGLEDSTAFRGIRGTAHGNTTRKLREAASRGARGVIFVHERGLTGLPWEAVAAEWSGDVLIEPDAPSGASVPFVAWVSGERLTEILQSFGRDWSVLRTRARRPDFRPIPLGVHGVVRIRSTVRTVLGVAVVGRLPGSDPLLAGETVVVTANYDHLGPIAGFGVDSVFNGARDNAAGVAAVIGAARVLRGDAQRLRRSVTFLALTATEGTGTDQPFVAVQLPAPPERVAAVVNVKRPSLSGDPPVVSAVDAEDTGLAVALEAAAQQEGVTVGSWQGLDPQRDDHAHLAFARLGIPAITLIGGAGMNGDDGTYFLQRFHQPDDAFDPAQSFHGVAKQARLVARLVRMIANADDAAAWAPGSPYRDAWERLQRRRGARP